MLFNMKRICALLLALALLCSMLPVGTVWAAKETELTAADYAEADLVFDLIDKAESAPATRSVTQEQKTQAAMEVVMASDSYVEGSLEQSGNSFTWWTESGIRCVYSPRMRKIQSELKETGEDVIVNEPVATRGGFPSGNQVYLVAPYYGYDSNFTDQYKNEAQRVAETIGDTDGYTLYSGEAATVDKVAQAVSNGAVVFFDSHGTTDYENPYDELDCITGANYSYMCLTSAAGLTTQDYEDGAAYDSKGAFVNGAAIANHMTNDSPNGILWMALCLSMGTDTMHAPLREKGVEVVYGYSQSVTFECDYRYEETFWGELTAGKTVAQAVAAMKNKWGNWDWSTQIADDYGSYDGYATIEEARADYSAFPVVVSSEDTWPGQRTGSSYGADSLQTVQSTYTLVEVGEDTDPTDPSDPTEPTEPDPGQDDNTVVASGTCGDNLTWTLIDDGTLTISGTGAMENYFYSSPAPWRDDCDNIETVVIKDGVTSIGDCSFNACRSLTSITIADSVATIGDYAFEGCSSLTSIKIPDSVTTIGYAAFHLCDSLTEIVVDAENTAYSSDRYGVLFNKDKTELICCPGGKTGVYTIPDGVTSIGYCAFSWCSNLTGIIFSESVTTMDKWAFADCISLTELTLPNSVIYIGYYAFAGCSGLTGITIADSVTAIGGYAFDGCSSLTDVYYGGTTAQWTALSNRPDVPYVHYECKSPENHWVTETVPGACETAGYTYKYCPCGYESDKETTSAPGHTKVTENATVPTCTKEGYTGDTVCTVCGQTLQTGESIPVTDHSEVIENAVDPTCIAEGYTGDIVCTVCGETVRTGKPIPMTDHSYIGGVCSGCGAAEPLDLEAFAATVPVLTAESEPVSGGGILSWEAVEGATCYKVYRASSKSGSYKLLETVEGTELKVSVSSGKTRYYKIKAVHEDGETVVTSKYSNYVKVKGVCAQPQIVEVYARASNGKPYIDWDKVSGAKKYYVYRVNEDGTMTRLTSTTKTYYTHTKAEVGVEYTYVVRAIASSSSRNSIYSEPVTCLTKCARPVLKISLLSSSGKPELDWKNITGAVSYEVWRAAENEEFTCIAEVTESIFVDESAIVDVEYEYQIVAVAENPDANSAPSDDEDATAKCAKPVASAELVDNKPMITWGEVDGAVKYYVYRSTSKTGTYKKIGTVDAEEGESYRDTKAKKNKTYYYKIVAVSEETKSSYSSYVKIKSK